MNADLLLALLGFTFATLATPGPNNMMLLASGVNFGLRRTVPHILGVCAGHAFLVFMVSMGLSGLFHAVPQAIIILKVLSVAYMLWLAWKIAHAAAPRPGQAGGKPFSFLQAAAFQWVNPKAWAMAMGAVSAYAGEGGLVAVLTISAVFAAVNLPSVSAWVILGEALRHWLQVPARLRAFNGTMAALLVASLVPVLRI
ncbi:MAG: LysE family translocator [Alphaproteobacteria bacterium]|nr:LysE family translocator [Alphaproteobacteria bacterium]